MLALSTTALAAFLTLFLATVSKNERRSATTAVVCNVTKPQAGSAPVCSWMVRPSKIPALHNVQQVLCSLQSGVKQ